MNQTILNMKLSSLIGKLSSRGISQSEYDRILEEIEAEIKRYREAKKEL